MDAYNSFSRIFWRGRCYIKAHIAYLNSASTSNGLMASYGLQRKIFYNYRETFKKFKSYFNNKRFSGVVSVPILFSFNLFSPSSSNVKNALGQDTNNKNRDVIDLIERGKALLLKKENPNKAEILYIRALHLALERNDRMIIARVQDLLANLALETNQLDKAEILFRNVLQNLVTSGTPQTDPAVLEISLKLASIYARKGDKDLALAGYQWSIEVCRKNLEEMDKKNATIKNKDYRNSLALLGMILDSYGRYLHDRTDNELAFACTLEALDISKKLYGEKDIRTLTLLNDLSSIKSEMGDYDEALEYVVKAIDVTESSPAAASASEKAVFYTNLSFLYNKQGKTEEAESAFKRALLEVSKTNDDALKSHIAAMAGNLLKDQNKTDENEKKSQ